MKVYWWIIFFPCASFYLHIAEASISCAHIGIQYCEVQNRGATEIHIDNVGY